MNADGYSRLLTDLDNDLQKWSFGLSFNPWKKGQEDYGFSSIVGDARLRILVTLGADGRGYLAEMVNTALNGVKEVGLKFGYECREKSPEISLENLFAVHKFSEELIKIDKLFKFIDDAIRATDLHGSGKGKGYTPLFAPVSYLSKEICNELNIKSATLNKYAKEAGIINRPARGNRNFRYSSEDRETIFRHITESVSDTKVVKAARQILAEIETKSKVSNSTDSLLPPNS